MPAIYGKHLKVLRLGYTHHGVGVGDQRVIHFQGGLLEGQQAVIVESSLADFLQGSQLIICEHRDSLPAQEVAKRAHSKLGYQRYHLGWDNCEHFAMWCVTGRFQSEQVRRCKGAVIGAARSAGSRLGPLVAVTVTAAEMGDALYQYRQNRISEEEMHERCQVAAATGIGGAAGASSGAALGAAMGSIVPGAGTLIGAGIGAVVGGIAGSEVGNYLRLSLRSSSHD